MQEMHIYPCIGTPASHNLFYHFLVLTLHTSYEQELILAS